MAYLFGYNLTQLSEQIIKTLMTYRGMTAKQLTSMLYGLYQYGLSEEKSVYNYLRKLKNQGLVKAHKLQANVANGSIYYLTPKGYQYGKDMLNIAEGAMGTGWIYRYQEFGECTLGDLSYDLYEPPLKQPAHHLMLIDFFIRLKTVAANYEDELQHRINLYSSRKYEIEGQKYQYRPDGEISFNGKTFAIEIDRATESHEQLLQKFETYNRYMDYVSTSGSVVDRIDGIIFVVESKRREHGLVRRWTNILSAFFKKLNKYQNQMNLIMTSLDFVGDSIHFELNRESLESKAREELKSILKNKGYHVVPWIDSNTKESTFAHVTKDDYYHVYFNPISQEFESKIYTRYLNFQNKMLDFAQKQEKMKGLRYVGHEKFVFYDKRKPVIINGFSHYKIESDILRPLLELPEGIQTRSFNAYLNFSIYE